MVKSLTDRVIEKVRWVNVHKAVERGVVPINCYMSLAINVLSLSLTVLWRPALCAHFTDEETLIQRGWVAQLVSDRTRGLNPDLSDIRAKLSHSALYCLPALDHITCPRQYLYSGLSGSKASVLSAASPVFPPKHTPWGLTLVAGTHWAYGSHNMPSSLRRDWWFGWGHPCL